MASIPLKSVWIDQMFEAQAVRDGGVIRRSVADVNRYASLDLLVERVKAEGFHLVQTGDQYVVLCHHGHFQVIC